MKIRGITIKGFITLSLVLLVLFTCGGLTAFAAEDFNVNVSLNFKDGDFPIVGAEFKFFKVADVSLPDGKITVTEEFAKYGVKIDEDQKNWPDVAKYLAPLVKEDALTPAYQITTDANGFCSLTLNPGVYLWLGEKSPLQTNNYYYSSTPALVLLPIHEGVEWFTKVSLVPKTEKEEPVPDPVSRKVKKVWDDKGYEDLRPAEIEIQLLKDGEEFEIVKLSAANDWGYSWTDLDGSCDWSIAEVPLDFYDITPKADETGVNVTITNTFNLEKYKKLHPNDPVKPDDNGNKDKQKKEKLPQTGMVVWPIPAIFALGLLFIIIGLIVKGKKVKR